LTLGLMISAFTKGYQALKDVEYLNKGSNISFLKILKFNKV